MAFRDFPDQGQGVELLQRSLERKRLGHAYLFTGQDLADLEGIAAALAKTLSCRQPVTRSDASIDCCEQCLSCQKISHDNHPDVHWVRPESKTRVITIDQMRELMQEIYLKPSEAQFKVCIIVAAYRMNEKAANAFLKTLEEPPKNSVLILLTTELPRILETILSRCLRLNFGGDGFRALDPAQLEWLRVFVAQAAAPQKSLLGRYQLLDHLLQKLEAVKGGLEDTLMERSPLHRHPDAEQSLRDRWEDELKAAIEAEYRLQRQTLVSLIQWWLRDVWLCKLHPHSEAEAGASLLRFPELTGATLVAQRITDQQALENLQVIEQLQRWLHTNVQEALALEVGLLKLNL